MPPCLKMAEKIYQSVKEQKGFTDDPIEDLNNLMSELRNAIKGTEIKLVCNYIDFAELRVKPVHESKIKLDLSLIPKSHNSQEFILWLATFIEKLIINDTKELPPIRSRNRMILPNYVYEENNITTLATENNGEEIMEYFRNK